MLFGKGNARNFWNYVWRTDMRMLHTYDQYWKAKEMPAIFCKKYFWRTDGRATGGAEPNATRNWCVINTDGIYFYCFSMIVQDFAEATTDTIWVFHFLTKQAFCAHRLSTLAQSDDKQTRGGKRGHEKALVKMHMKCKLRWMLLSLFTGCRLCRRPPMPLPLSSTLLLRFQGYQTCVGAGMLAPGLANVALVQHLLLIGRVDVGRWVGW